MQVIENENAEKIIRALIPKKILELNPVIAGGFVVSLYHLAMRYSGEVYDNDLAIRIERACNPKIWSGVSQKILMDLGIDKKFGDIDFWFLKDNEVWKEDHNANFLFKDFVDDRTLREAELLQQALTNPGSLPPPITQKKLAGFSKAGTGGSAVIASGNGGAYTTSVFPPGLIVMTGGAGGGGGVGGGASQMPLFPAFNPAMTSQSHYGYKKTYHSAQQNHKDMFIDFGLSEDIIASSYWANTFTTGSKITFMTPDENKVVGGLKIQIVKKQYEDIDELFTRFDISNCCAAYYNGKFYFHDDFKPSSDEHILRPGAAFHKPTTLGKIWAASRAFKYAERFNLEFSKEVCDSITDTFIESEILLEKIKDMDPLSFIDLGGVEEINDPYGKNGTVSIEKLNGMIMSLFGHGPALFSMKEFDMDQIFVFMNTKHHAMKEFIKTYIEKEGDRFNQKLNPLFAPR